MKSPSKLRATNGLATEVFNNDAALELKKNIAGLLVRNYSSSEIAKVLGVSTSKVASYIKAIREEWSLLTSSNFKEFQAQELIKLDQIEREAWLSWEKSKQTRTKKKTTYIKESPSRDPMAALIMTEELVLDSEVREEVETEGDPKYLDVIMKSMAHRAKILGVDKVNVNVFSANININQDQPEYQQRVDQFLAQFGGDYGRIIDASLNRDGTDESVDTEAKYSISEASIIPDEN